MHSRVGLHAANQAQVSLTRAQPCWSPSLENAVKLTPSNPGCTTNHCSERIQFNRAQHPPDFAEGTSCGRGCGDGSCQNTLKASSCIPSVCKYALSHPPQYATSLAQLQCQPHLKQSNVRLLPLLHSMFHFMHYIRAVLSMSRL
jgi:hypothetical protein